jgi:hypothetical protein
MFFFEFKQDQQKKHVAVKASSEKNSDEGQLGGEDVRVCKNH